MIYILTGSIRSGKTTALMQWCVQKQNVSGILTPDVLEERMFFDIQTKEYFPMLAKQGEEIVAIGKFNFSKSGFEKAIQNILSNNKTNNCLVIDEIGPLELKGEGFCSSLIQVLKTRNDKLVLVIREGLLDDVCNYFGIKDEMRKIISVAGLKDIQI